MKKILLLFITLLPILGFSSQGVSLIKNAPNKWDIYYTAPNGKKFFIYEDTGPINTASSPDGDLIYQTDNNIFWILFTCQRFDFTCARYVDLETNQISNTFTNIAPLIDKDQNTVGILQNLKQKVVLLFNYPNDFSFIVTPIFTACTHPFIYQLPHLADGPDAGSQFLSDGSLHLNIIMDRAPKDQQVTIPIDYKKLFEDCRANS